ncbi:hypothetical protein TD95_003879 [Thielaviopsis punctulata]|uniref:DUF4604 domain-containing protein n=1 Tax=Thielaviopsis punctulata TaxID=72032 RepID=A0A0F4ZKB5_9PEZI|nr:hypothetical protein TD95_003879 [Thielaviopsis punctulata]
MPPSNYKNLSYTASVPPFLARLRHSSSSGPSDAPDPILAARRRPAAAQRSASQDAEDAPVVLDEHGNAVDAAVAVGRDGTVTVLEGRAGGGQEAGADDITDLGDGTQDRAHGTDKHTNQDKKQATAVFGTSRKRRAAKIIGAEDDEVENHKTQHQNTAAATTTTTSTTSTTTTTITTPTITKPKKKSKKIKLSFDEE